MNLKRVLEPEVMDTPAEAQDYDAMDHSVVNQSFVDDLAEGAAIEGDLLDLGCGTAQIPIALCERHENCRVMAVDLASHMLDLARYNVEAAGLTDRIQLDLVDAKQLPFEDEMFDLVVANSITHHLPEPLVALREATRVTKRDGRLFIRDLMRPESDEEVRRLVERYAGNEGEHARQMFDDSLRAALDLDEIRELVTRLGFEAETVEATSDRHWTWSARR